MLLTKHNIKDGTCWAVDGFFLPPRLNSSTLLDTLRKAMFELLTKLLGGVIVIGWEVARLDPVQEVERRESPTCEA